MRSYAGDRPDSATLVRRATAVVQTVTARLADPARVVEIARTPGNTPGTSQGRGPAWQPVGLDDGYPAMALLFAELAAEDAAQRRRVQAYLSAAVDRLRSGPPRLYTGMASVAFAGHIAATSFGGYAGMLQRLDREIAEESRNQVRSGRLRVSAGTPIGAHDGYDVINGATGIGRYLLCRYEMTGDPAVGEALADVLDMLVSIGVADDVWVEGARLPAWWAYHIGTGPAGHLNLGLAHGVAGPLALLALAWRAGVRVDRQDEAVDRIVALLSRWRVEHREGPGWPRWVVREEYDEPARSRSRGREVWCYGGAGVGRALYLAGAAFDRRDWRHQGDRGVRAAIDTAEDRVIHDFALCHGWSGLLQIVSRMATDTEDPEYRVAADLLACRVLEGMDQESPFGYRYRPAAGYPPVDRPGFLEGAAGVALALHTYARCAPPTTGWDAALLLA